MAETTTDAAPAGDTLPSLDDWANQPDSPEVAEPTADEQLEEQLRDAKPKAKPAPKAQSLPIRKAPSADELAAKAEADEQAQKEKPAEKPAPKPKEPPRPYDPAAKIKLIVDGEEEEITIEEALRRARKNSAADRRFQEAARLRQEAEALKPLESFKGMFSAEDITEAKRALKAEGRNPDDPAAIREKLSEQVVLSIIEREKLAKENPAELARRQEEKRRIQVEQELEAERKKQEDAKVQARRQAIQAHLNKEFTETLKTSDLPATPYTISRMADVMQHHARQGIPVSPAEAAQIVKQDLAKEQGHVIQAMSPQQTVKALAAKLDAIPIADVVPLLPKAFLANLRKYDIDQLKAGKAKPPPSPAGFVTKKPRPPNLTSQKEVDALLEKWAQG